MMKHYSERAIWTGSLLGGPLVGAYLLAHNASCIQKTKQKYLIIIASILLTVLLAILVVFGSRLLEKIPRYIIPFSYAGIFVLLFKKLQEKEINELADQTRPYSLWRVAAISVFGCLVTFGPIVGIGIMMNNEQLKEFGITHNQIHYFDSDFSDEEITKLGQILTDVGLFTDANQISIMLNHDDGKTHLYCIVDSVLTTNNGFIRECERLRDKIQSHYADEKIVINLCYDFPQIALSIE